jgi:transcriptional regulator GlxA family with amidase domain
VVLDVGSGILAGFSMGVHYRAVDRLRAAALYAGAVVSEWREDRIAFGAAVEGTRRALVALAATLAGSERQTALYLAAQIHTEHRETVAALGACLAEWGQQGVPLGADAQAVTRRLLYRVVEITEMWQQIKADDP